MFRNLAALACLLFSQQLLAFTCYITLVKDNCWTNYDVTVNVLDAELKQPLLTLVAPKGQTWVRQSIDCRPGQILTYAAQFSPIIWTELADKVYQPTRFTPLPNNIKKGTSAWSLYVCFSGTFAEVPMPPNTSQLCQCDFSSVPDVPPAKDGVLPSS